jgi:hypothetical protein
LLLATAGCASVASRTQLHPAVHVDTARAQVDIRATVACRRGFLEQVCCGRGTREYESLLVTDAPASVIQAALIAAGLRPGAPGVWHAAADGTVERREPTGDPVEVRIHWMEGGVAAEVAVSEWLDDARPTRQPPSFVFAGSRFVSGPQGERFAADLSGSVLGLVTFGDEVVALREVEPDKVDVAPARWRARSSAIPPEGTPVTLVLRRAGAPGI